VSRIFVTDDTASVHVEIFRDDEDGNATAACLTRDWTTEPGRCDSLADVVEEAGIHLDQQHAGGA
jgi:hypothetical protein